MTSASRTCSANSQTSVKSRKKTNESIFLFYHFYPSIYSIHPLVQLQSDRQNNISNYQQYPQFRQMQQFLFPEAVTYPDFFNHNLADPNRILKVITGKDSWARSFYFQLLKLIFELQTDEEKAKQYIEFMLSIGQKTIRRIKNVQQLNKFNVFFHKIQTFFKQFLERGQTQFQDYINQHKEIDESLVAVLNKIIIGVQLQTESPNQKLKYLGELFEFTLLQFDNGIKFQESDTFLYIQNQQTIYMAFLNISEFDEEQEADTDQKYDDSVQKVMSSVSLQKNQKQKDLVQVVKKQSPVDYLFKNKFRQDSNKNNETDIKTNQARKKVQQKQLITQNQAIEQQKQQQSQKQMESSQYTLCNKKQWNQSQKPKIVNSIYIKHGQTIQQQIGNEFESKNRQSIVQEKTSMYMEKNRPSMKYENSLNKQDLFYQPPARINVANIIKNNQNPMQPKLGRRDPLDFANDSEKGTFYRKFTETRILNLLTEPYRTKVKMLKSRFIGVHSRNHMHIKHPQI